MKAKITTDSAPAQLFVCPALEAVEVMPSDLSRFEGEGGLAAPAPDSEWIDVPLENAKPDGMNLSMTLQEETSAKVKV